MKKKKKSKLQKKKDNPNSKYWRNKADLAFGAYIHATQKYCLVCELGGIKLDAHHLIGRSRAMTRHDPRNGVILCSYHHNRDVECSPHAGPIGFSEFLRNHYPAKYDYVIANQHKLGKPDYRANCEELTKLIMEVK